MLGLLLASLVSTPAPIDALRQSPPVLALQRYEIDARTSTVGFDGESTLHNFTGKTHAITADVRFDPLDPSRIAGGAVWVEARTLDTDNGSRDEEMRDHLDVKKHPQIVFRLDSVQGRMVDRTGEFRAKGRFTIKGVEKERELKFHVEPAGKEGSGELRILGELRFKMTEHGIERPSVLFVTVDDEVRVWLDLRLAPMKAKLVDARVCTLTVEEKFTPSDAKAEPTRRTTTERLWTTGTTSFWERTLDPCWYFNDGIDVRSFDPRTGLRNVAPPGFDDEFEHPCEKLLAPGYSGTCEVKRPDGLHQWSIRSDHDVAASLPNWALDPGAWSNGPIDPALAPKTAPKEK